MSHMRRDDAKIARNLFYQEVGQVHGDRKLRNPETAGRQGAQGKSNVTSGGTGGFGLFSELERNLKASGFQSSGGYGATTGQSDHVRRLPSDQKGSKVTSRPRDLTKAADRLSTFFDWPPASRVGAEKLAAEGFYYLGRGDRVECAFRGGQLHRWEGTDDPEVEHGRHFPQCPFVVSSRTYLR